MIHALKKRALRTMARQQARGRAETKDAVLWDVIPSQRLCRVKVQGSNALIECKYPENWEQTPVWLKPGNAVKIQHTGGNQQRFAIMGHGVAVPTAWKHSSLTDSWTPPVGTGDDAVLTRCYVLQLPGVQKMQVYVTLGTYRINGTIYTLDYITLKESNTVDFSSAIPFDDTADVVDIAAASTSSHRLDAVCVGTDMIIDYVQGTPAAIYPELPSIPAGHVLLDWVYVPPNVTEIDQSLIHRDYVAPFVALISVSYTGGISLDWSTASKDLTINALDQYGNGIIGTNWLITGVIVSGTGYLETTGTTEITKSTGTANSGVVFTYNRIDNYDSGGTESCPVYIKFTLEQSEYIFTQTVLILLDSGGDAIT